MFLQLMQIQDHALKQLVTILVDSLIEKYGVRILPEL